jgi:hypothetical protein
MSPPAFGFNIGRHTEKKTRKEKRKRGKEEKRKKEKKKKRKKEKRKKENAKRVGQKKKERRLFCEHDSFDGHLPPKHRIHPSTTLFFCFISVVILRSTLDLSLLQHNVREWRRK